jgi:hypothetical protein
VLLRVASGVDRLARPGAAIDLVPIDDHYMVAVSTS